MVMALLKIGIMRDLKNANVILNGVFKVLQANFGGGRFEE